jgi:carboxypeptidase family protein/TonB-dependent receptor-like protein
MLRPLRCVAWIVIVTVIAAAHAAHAQPVEPPAGAALDAGTPVDIAGRVIDALGRPVRGATVAIEATAHAAVTDAAGRYHVERAPLGASIVVEAAGYTTGLGTVSGAAIADIVLLTEQQSTEVIDVHGDIPPESPGAAKLDRTEMTRIPGTGGDLVRTLSIMPGVVAPSGPALGRNGIVIRGSAPQDSKLLIDGFEVPLLYHAIGQRAIVPTEAIDKLDYVPGGFGVEHGYAASGIVALTTRAGGDQRSEQAEVSVIDGGVIAQGGSGARLRYMIAFRRSVIDLVLPYVLPSSLDLSLTSVPRYYDEQARVDYQLSPAWSLAVSTIGSDDLLELYFDKAENPDKRLYNRTRFLRLTTAASWHDGPWSATLATSGLAQQIDFELGTLQYGIMDTLSSSTRAELTRSAHEVGGLTDVVWRAGGELVLGHQHLSLALPRLPHEGQPMGMFDPKDTSTRFDGAVWTPDAAQWTAVTASLGAGVRVTTGVRIDEFTRGGDVAVQPRGELAWQLTPGVKARLSAGAYRRPPENREELLHAELEPERSTQTIAGVEYEPVAGARLQTSVYYTDRTHLITPDANGVLGNTGRGTTYGAELLGTVRQGPWFLWLAGTLSHSTRVDFPGAERRLFDYDQPINLNAAASWKRGRWQLGGRFELYSGMPTTAVVGAVFDTNANRYDPIYGDTNAERLPIHHQLDLRVDRSWAWGAVQMTGFLDVQNVYLHSTVTNYGYSYDYSKRLAFTGLPIIPSIGLRGVL